MNESWIYWILGVISAAAIIMIFGYATTRNLPAEQKKNRARKFAAVALALMVFSIPVFSPYISSYSRTRYLDELKAENLNTVEETAKFEEKQTKNIESLKSEVSDLREEIYQLNRYYKFVIQMFSTMIVVACLLFAFGKKENATEEIQSNQISKL